MYNANMTTNRIVIDPKIYGGKPCIHGTRITVTMILELLEDGITFQQVIKDYYPQLKADDIKACLQYARAALELVPIRGDSRRKFGSARGKIKVSNDFDQPLELSAGTKVPGSVQ